MRYLSYQIIFFLFTISIFAQSPHGESFNLDCSECHNADSWKIDLAQISYDHSKTDFALIGQHSNIDCQSCHESLVFSKMDKDCISCHRDIHQATVGLDCANCHTSNNWIVKDIIGLHQKSRFPLLGAHQTDDCAQCHARYAELNFEPLSVNSNLDCYACHKQNYHSTQNPNHVAANFSTDCQGCHNISAFSWTATNIDHNFFPLLGGHALPSCFSCHQQGGNFSGLSQECYSCHQQTYEATQNPNHIAAGMPTTCDVCHSIQGWKPAQFNHDLTAFPLTGAHINTDCQSCHQNGYTGTSTDCISCHQTDYNNTTNPNHITVSFPTTCIDCHSTTAWQPATFDHDNQYFPIYSGKHQDKWSQCSECHTNPGNYGLFSCIDCHEHNKPETDDDHQGVQGYVYNSPDCLSCHPQGRKDGAFNHATSNFPLIGLHQTASCVDCHQNGYAGTTSVCSDCHLTEYNGAVNPNHQSLSISTDCGTCHTPTADWQPALFPQHDQVYQLLGRHSEIANDCASCHSGNYTATQNQCVGCHQSAYNAAVIPNHTTAGLSTECSTCHNANGWSPSIFDHSTTGFTLLGAHQPLQCSDCHNGVVTGLISDCLPCHQTDYNTAANHAAQSYPTNCEQCHNSIAWNQTTFNHLNTNFPLTGAHINTSCQSCHQSGYNNTPRDCYACHTMDYNNTINPNHTAASFPTTCVECHSTSAWTPATFDHDNQYFPIYSGKHQDKWNQCSECHTIPSNYSLFSCIDCHEHNRTDMDQDHQGVTNYVYNSINCFDCHPDGNDAPMMFNHSMTAFQLTGAHMQVECAECHSTNQQGLSTECIACHTQDYLKTVNPNHRVKGISTDCSSCHSTNNWSSGLKILEDSKAFQ